VQRSLPLGTLVLSWVTGSNRELRPYAMPPTLDDNVRMSMYAELLTNAQRGKVEELHGAALMVYTLDRRAEMLAASGPIRDATAFSVLAVEVAYDCALLNLCAESGVEVIAANFSHPTDDRHRLETELKAAGIDLVSLARRRKGSA
jgi:hypothetical protein